MAQWVQWETVTQHRHRVTTEDQAEMVKTATVAMDLEALPLHADQEVARTVAVTDAGNATAAATAPIPWIKL